MAGNSIVFKTKADTAQELEEKSRQLKKEIALNTSIFSICPDYMFLLGLDGKIVEVSKSVKKAFNSQNKIIDCKISQINIIHIKDLHKFIKSINSILNGKSIEQFRSIFITPEKEEIDVLVRISPVEYDNEIIGIFINATDITDQLLLEESKQASSSLQKALTDKEMLVREIHHRTKNNLMIMASLFALTSADIEDENAKAIFNQTHSRVKSMALVHEKLYRSKDLKFVNFGDYIRNLGRELSNIFLTENNNVQLIMDVEDLKINIETAINVGLILNEILTNSIKYAFPDGAKGNIFINFHRTDNHYILTVADDGVGLPEDLDLENCGSLGLSLVRNLVGQIEGDLIIKQDFGTEITICFQEIS
ncbi:MAG: histidine kinase dimerization/phosphoacceptor domain -containing protein [Euryarchaeota archaeon]|nr:histidine kinase dimerization/phosphoacceptor domain -containing protein [Euryarchaeota archaeon]